MGRLEHQYLPDLPPGHELQLALINADFPTGPLPAEVMHNVVAQPAYWAFCWGSGQALARYLLDNPQLVAAQRVLDLGSAPPKLSRVISIMTQPWPPNTTQSSMMLPSLWSMTSPLHQTSTPC